MGAFFYNNSDTYLRITLKLIMVFLHVLAMSVVISVLTRNPRWQPGVHSSATDEMLNISLPITDTALDSITDI